MIDDRLRFFEEAADEIEEARRWYKERSELAERAFLREVDESVEAVTEAPERWPLHASGTRRFVFPSFPYSFIYFIENAVVHVVAVSHDKRRPGYWRKRLPR